MLSPTVPGSSTDPKDFLIADGVAAGKLSSMHETKGPIKNDERGT